MKTDCVNEYITFNDSSSRLHKDMRSLNHDTVSSLYDTGKINIYE